MKRDIWLYTPFGEMVESPGQIVVHARDISVIASVDFHEKFDPGILRVTEAALDELALVGVVRVLTSHLQGIWGAALEKEAKRDNTRAMKTGGSIYNCPQPGIMVVTYCGDNTTVILSQEW